MYACTIFACQSLWNSRIPNKMNHGAKIASIPCARHIAHTINTLHAVMSTYVQQVYGQKGRFLLQTQPFCTAIATLSRSKCTLCIPQKGSICHASVALWRAHAAATSGTRRQKRAKKHSHEPGKRFWFVKEFYHEYDICIPYKHSFCKLRFAIWVIVAAIGGRKGLDTQILYNLIRHLILGLENNYYLCSEIKEKSLWVWRPLYASVPH